MPAETSDSESISVRVAVRLRPLVPSEKNEGCVECIRTETDADGGQRVLLRNDKRFAFDSVFDAHSSQADIYQKTAAPLVAKCLDGYNATMFAYGQTGSGKTYTMGGGFGEAASAPDGTGTNAIPASCVVDGSGIIPRAVYDIFNGVDALRATDATADVEVTVAYLELYNEQIRDLLAPATKAAPTGGLDLREDTEKGGIVVAGLTHEVVASADDVLAHLARGSVRRTTGSTQMNAQSSRSHAICTISVQQRGAQFKWGKLNLVDLAGSERQKRTKAAGTRLKEGISINKGLFVLGNVISALGDSKKREAGVHVPYRDSKLTRLLQDSLGGNSHTLMIACCSPADSNFEETANTLKYANRARNIECKASVNSDPAAAELHNLRQQVQLLQLQLLGGKAGKASTDALLSLTSDSKVSNSGAELAKMQQDAALLIEQLDLEKKRREKLEQALEAATRDNDSLTAERDRVRLQLEQFTKKADGTIIKHNTKDISGESSVLEEQLATISDLRQQLARYQAVGGDALVAAVQAAGNVESQSDECGGPHAPENAPESEEDSDFEQQQREMAEGLKSLAMSLQQKEVLLKTLSSNDSSMKKLCGENSAADGSSEKSQQALQNEVDKLKRERDRLEDRLRDASISISPHDAMIQQQQRAKLKSLESKLAQAKLKLQELARLRRLKDQGDAHKERLKREISDAKHKRAELQRRMKDAAVTHREEKKQQRHELNQMQRKDRKKQVQLRNLEFLYARQNSVLQRKEEQVAAVTKRMRSLLEKQREAQKNATRVNNSNDTGTSDKCKRRLQRAIDVKITLALAKETLAKETELRKTAAARLQAARSADESCIEAGEESDEASQLAAEVAQRTETIAQLQQRLAAFDSQTGYGADQMKTTWATLKTARAARSELKVMFELAVGNGIQRARLEQAQHEAEDAVAALRESESKHEAEAAASAARELEMQQQYESQLMSLLSLAHANHSAGTSTQQMNGVSNLRALCDDRLRSAQDVHDRMVEANKKLSCENQKLKAQLQNKAAKANVKKKASLVSDSEDEDDWMEESDSDEYDDHSSDSDWEEGPSKKRTTQKAPIVRKKEDAVAGLQEAKNLMQQAFDEERRQQQPALKGKSGPAADCAGTAVIPSLTSLPIEAAEREEALTKMTVPTLKEMLRQQKLKVSGKKADLVTRLMQASKGSPGRKSTIFCSLYANEAACTCNLDDGSECLVCSKATECDAELESSCVDATKDEQETTESHVGERAVRTQLGLPQAKTSIGEAAAPKGLPQRPSTHAETAVTSKTDTMTAKPAGEPDATSASAHAHNDGSARQHASAPPRPGPVTAAKPKAKPQIDLSSVASAIASANAAASSVAKMQSTVSSCGKHKGMSSDEMRRRLDAFKQKKSVTAATGTLPRRAFGTVSVNRHHAHALGGSKRKIGTCSGSGSGSGSGQVDVPVKKARQPLHMPKHTHLRPVHSSISRPLPR